ncbi:MAG: M1 family metallopeptidase, partial [Ornithinibacter sp.]
HIGDDAFVAGVNDYLRSHEFGNGELAEFLTAMESTSGGSLEGWADAWLRTSGADRLAVDTSGVLTRTAPPAQPAWRPHTLDVAAFSSGAEVLREPVVLDAGTDVLTIAGVGGLPRGSLVVPNAGDLTWAEVTLDEASLARLAAELSSVPDATARSVVWVSLLGSLARAEVDPRVVLDVFEGAWWQESDAAVLSRVSTLVLGSLVPMFLPPEEQEEALQRVADSADRLLERASGTAGARGDGLAVVAARVLARASADTDRLRRWASGDGIPGALAGDADFRWIVQRRLAALGELTEEAIETAEAADRSLAGRLAAYGVRAVRPTHEAKEWAWATLRDDADLSNYAALEVASSFWVARDRDLLRPYVDGVGDLIVGMSARMGDDALSRVVAALHPTRLVEDGSALASAAMLARDDLTPGVRRALVDADHLLREGLKSRRTFG